MIDFKSFRLDYHYSRMIGFKQLSIDDAYREYMKFLKYFGFMGSFNTCMVWRFKTFSQMYKAYFHARAKLIKGYVDFNNKRKDIYTMKPNLLNYNWYEDIELLFPFVPKDDGAFMLGGYWDTVLSMWLEYCSENKLYNSEIILNDEKELIDIGILRMCGYFPQTKYDD